MQAFITDNVGPSHWDELGMPGHTDLLSMTVQLYELCSPAGQTKGYIGLMKPMLLGNDLWLWFVGTANYTLSELRQAREICSTIVQARDENIYAEVSIYEPVARRFVEHLGFTEVVTENERTQYKWN